MEKNMGTTLLALELTRVKEWNRTWKLRCRWELCRDYYKNPFVHSVSTRSKFKA